MCPHPVWCIKEYNQRWKCWVAFVKRVLAILWATFFHCKVWCSLIILKFPIQSHFQSPYCCWNYYWNISGLRLDVWTLFSYYMQGLLTLSCTWSYFVRQHGLLPLWSNVFRHGSPLVSLWAHLQIQMTWLAAYLWPQWAICQLYYSSLFKGLD